jgi:hypothetical protein
MQCHDSPQRDLSHAAHRCMDGSSGGCARCVGRWDGACLEWLRRASGCLNAQSCLLVSRRHGSSIRPSSGVVISGGCRTAGCQLGSEITDKLEKTDFVERQEDPGMLPGRVSISATHGTEAEPGKWCRPFLRLPKSDAEPGTMLVENFGSHERTEPCRAGAFKPRFITVPSLHLGWCAMWLVDDAPCFSFFLGLQFQQFDRLGGLWLVDVQS